MWFGVVEDKSDWYEVFYVVEFCGPILEAMQYEADPWAGLSKLTAPAR